MLLLAAGRFLVKRRKALLPAVERPAAKSAEDWMDAGKVLAEVQCQAALRMESASEAVAAARAGGLLDDAAFNEAAEELMAAASWRGYATMLEALCGAAEAMDSPPAVAAALRRLAALFGCHIVMRHAGVAVAVPGGHVVPEALRRLCEQLRGDAVALVDAFDYEDRVLNSTLGVRSGRVYEALYAASRRSSKDFQEPFKGYREFLQPLLDQEYLKCGASRARSRL